MRNIVICCDGTGNEISENISNVLKLYRCLRKTGKTTPRQLVFYDPGVGTLARTNAWQKWRQDLSAIFGLATGYGLDDNILDCYEFIVDNYEDGDAIYLLGFSRGAYTVRVLAGLIHSVGLIAKTQRNLAGPGLTAYKQFSSDFGTSGGWLDRSKLTDAGASGDPTGAEARPAREDQPAQFARILSVKWPTIKFVGVWDTVASVIVPRPDRLYLPSLLTLAFVRDNPSIEIFRQAIAIDERRRMFRLQPWDEGGKFRPHRYAPSDKWKDQDSRQVWFAGVHADIGGGYPEKQSALSKYPLLWMIEEAVQAGLTVNRQTVNQLGWGRQRRNSSFRYVAPGFLPDPSNPASAAWQPHNSMNLAWRAIEYLPKADKYREWQARRSAFGFYIPDGEPRPIPDGAFIHRSALDKIAQDDSYRPVNIPASYQPVELLPEPAAAMVDDVGEEEEAEGSA